MLFNKNIIITGGAGLLGKEHALAVMEEGANAFLLDTNRKELLKFVKHTNKYKNFKGKCFAKICDVTSEAQVKKFLNFLKKNNYKPDVLINNVASNPSSIKKDFTTLDKFTVKQWQRDLDINLTSSFICSKIIGQEMAKNKKGNIINISSDLGLIAPDQRIYNKSRKYLSTKPVSYSVTKHAIIGLTKYLATYWADHGVRSNCLVPGGVENNQNKYFIKKVKKLIPLGRMARKNEYKGAIKFLCSDASSYMNGANLVMDGGRTIW